ncbi:MAG: porin family protein [Prevotellamassilia sp.]|nr:porin family protein [Prevotellamassilia sp.]
MKRILLILSLFLGIALVTAAQQRRVQNKPFIDERRFHYGFFVGAHDQSMRLDGNGYVPPLTNLSSAESGQQQWVAQTDQTNFGFSVGVLGEWRINSNLALRILPSLHFGSRHVTFRELGTDRTEMQDMKSCFIGIPIDLKISAPRFNNYRPYVVTGIAPMYDLITSKQSQLRCKPFVLMLEAGMGCDMYLPFFKFIPELKFCFGLNNVLQKNRRDITDPSQLVFTQSIDRATIGMVVLTFYIE